MLSIEDEFKILMGEVLLKIASKKNNGEYHTDEAYTLTKMVNNCIDHGDSSNHGNSCPDGHSDPDCGWSPSMGYHCF